MLKLVSIEWVLSIDYLLAQPMRHCVIFRIILEVFVFRGYWAISHPKASFLIGRMWSNWFQNHRCFHDLVGFLTLCGFNHFFFGGGINWKNHLQNMEPKTTTSWGPTQIEGKFFQDSNIVKSSIIANPWICDTAIVALPKVQLGPIYVDILRI